MMLLWALCDTWKIKRVCDENYMTNIFNLKIWFSFKDAQKNERKNSFSALPLPKIAKAMNFFNINGILGVFCRFYNRPKQMYANLRFHVCKSTHKWNFLHNTLPKAFNFTLISNGIFPPLMTDALSNESSYVVCDEMIMEVLKIFVGEIPSFCGIFWSIFSLTLVLFLSNFIRG